MASSKVLTSTLCLPAVRLCNNSQNILRLRSPWRLSNFHYPEKESPSYLSGRTHSVFAALNDCNERKNHENCSCNATFNFLQAALSGTNSHWSDSQNSDLFKPQRPNCSPESFSRSFQTPICHSVATEGHVPQTDTSPAHPIPELWLYNSRSRKKELFKPKVTGEVSMYVCGVTVYDYSHIGHARVYVAFDVLYRYLNYLGYNVKYVRNFTDVDDKIINRAAELGEEPSSLSARFCDEFHVDMAALRCLPPSVEPRVTAHMDHIIAMIEKIIGNGFGYVLEGGDVFFEVGKLPEYGSLSGRQQDEVRSGERVAVDQRKRNPSDFALWKSSKPGEVSWSSPWGPGRPGWHIECSAMSWVHLGSCIDIHGGGQDLIFPHHENELAQSRAANDDASVSYWLHNGFVNVDKEKMSKSLGNFFTIREVLKQYHPVALRWFLLGTQYRSPINYSQRQLELASDRAFYVFQILEDCRAELDGQVANAQPSKEAESLAASLLRLFHAAMADDLHTAMAVAAFSEPLRAMNDLLHTKKGRKDRLRIGSLNVLHSSVIAAFGILGLPTDGFQQILEELKDVALKRSGLSREELVKKIEEREEARSLKDFKRSDEIRAELAAMGVMLMDGGDGALWKPVSVVGVGEE